MPSRKPSINSWSIPHSSLQSECPQYAIINPQATVRTSSGHPVSPQVVVDKLDSMADGQRHVLFVPYADGLDSIIDRTNHITLIGTGIDFSKTMYLGPSTQTAQSTNWWYNQVVSIADTDGVNINGFSFDLERGAYVEPTLLSQEFMEGIYNDSAYTTEMANYGENLDDPTLTGNATNNAIHMTTYSNVRINSSKSTLLGDAWVTYANKEAYLKKLYNLITSPSGGNVESVLGYIPSISNYGNFPEQIATYLPVADIYNRGGSSINELAPTGANIEYGYWPFGHWNSNTWKYGWDREWLAFVCNIIVSIETVRAVAADGKPGVGCLQPWKNGSNDHSAFAADIWVAMEADLGVIHFQNFNNPGGSASLAMDTRLVNSVNNSIINYNIDNEIAAIPEYNWITCDEIRTPHITLTYSEFLKQREAGKTYFT